MEQYETIISMIALTMGVGWASGVNVYATIAMLGIMSATGNLALPAELDVLQNRLVIGAALVMYAVEFFADKIPGVDSGWDALHTFVRIPAGALIAAGTMGEMGPAVEVAAAILGGGLAATSHATKAGSRAMINMSPEPLTNWTASVTEDVAVVGGLWTAINYPFVWVGIMVAFILLAIWLLPKLWRGIKRLFAAIKRLLGMPSEPENVAVEAQAAAVAQSPVEVQPKPVTNTITANKPNSAG